jgi:hypothetical protein
MNTRYFSPAAIVLCVSLVAAAEPVVRPIERARAGHWILEKHTKVIGTVTEATYNTTWVESVVGRRVHLLRQEVSADQKTGIKAPTSVAVDLDQKSAVTPKDEDTATLATDDEIAIGDKKLKCKKVELVVLDPTLGKFTTTTWTSGQVPLFGLVRTVKTDKDGKELERTDLLAWGETGGAELPVPEKP